MANPGPRAMPEEWFSIIGAGLTTEWPLPLFIRYANWEFGKAAGGLDWETAEPRYKDISSLGSGLFYLIIQMAFLLQSASQVRALGVLDSILAILPLISGLVLLALDLERREDASTSPAIRVDALAVIRSSSAPRSGGSGCGSAS